MATVLQTDFAWPDVTIERGVIEGAGHRLVAGPSEPSPAAAVEGHGRGARPRRDPHLLGGYLGGSDSAAPARSGSCKGLGVGLDNIAVEAATARGAWVANVPDYCVEEVSDHAVGAGLWVVSRHRAIRSRGEGRPMGSFRRTSAPRRHADRRHPRVGAHRPLHRAQARGPRHDPCSATTSPQCRRPFRCA